jgi:hypothetical protein
LISEKFTHTYAPWATLITVIASLLGGYWQFRQLRHEETVSRMFDMSKEYRTSFLDVNLGFSDEWPAYSEKSIQTLPRANVKRQYADLVSKFLRSPDTRKRYEKLRFFYNSLGECVRAGLCDLKSANSMLGDDVLTFYHDMYPDLVSVRKYGYEADGIFDFIAKLKAAHLLRGM